VQQGFSHMFLDRAVGYAELFGDFGISHAVNPVQDEDFLGTRGQFFKYPFDCG
jgi:hypothetical protein